MGYMYRSSRVVLVAQKTVASLVETTAYLLSLGRLVVHRHDVLYYIVIDAQKSEHRRPLEFRTNTLQLFGNG